MPNLTSILNNRTIAGKHSDTSDIEYSLTHPYLRMLILIRNIGLCADIRPEIGHQEVVVAIEQDVANPSEQAWLAGAEAVRRQLIEHSFEARIRLVIIARPICSLQGEFFDLGRSQSKDKHILGADRIANLDIGAVEGPERQRTIHREFHVAGSRCFPAGGGDLFGHIGGGNDFLRERDPVVGQEGDLDQLARLWVIVNYFAEIVDQLDQHLCGPIAGRRFAAKNVHMRDRRLDAVIDEPQVLVHNTQRHQELALVLVNALGLNVEHRGGIEIHRGDPINDSREPFLVGALDSRETTLKLGIVGEFLEPAHLSEIGRPSRADGRIKQAREARIRHQQPSALRHTVGLVAETLWPKLVELRHQSRLHEFAMELRDTIDRVAPDDSEMRHPDLGLVTILYYRDALQAFRIVAPDRGCVGEKAPIDLIDKLQMARNDALQE